MGDKALGASQGEAATGADRGVSSKHSNSISCCCLLPVGCMAVVGLMGWEGEEMGSLELVGSSGAAIRRSVRDMLPVSKCMGYMSIPRASWGHA